jgi:hypothetical protein
MNDFGHYSRGGLFVALQWDYSLDNNHGDKTFGKQQ